VKGNRLACGEPIDSPFQGRESNLGWRECGMLLASIDEIHDKPCDIAVGDVVDAIHGAESTEKAAVDHNSQLLSPPAKHGNLDLQLGHQAFGAAAAIIGPARCIWIWYLRT